MEHPRIMLAYVHPGWVRHEMMESVLRTLVSGKYQLDIVNVESGTNVQNARNKCVRRFLDSGADHFWFVDSDMAWSDDVPERLLAYDVPIVSALYLGRHGDGKAFPVGMKWTENGFENLVKTWKRGLAMSTPVSSPNGAADAGVMDHLSMDDFDGGLTEVAGVGMGCCLIRREVFEALGTGGHPDQWPYAEGQTTTPTGVVAMSEDITFCVRAKAAGFSSYIASDVSVGHVKSFVMTPPDVGRQAVLSGAVVEGER